MKKLSLLALSAFLPVLVSAQCVCEFNPPPTTYNDTVSNVSELDAAITNASNNNGNTTIWLEDGNYVLTNALLFIGSHMQNLTIRSVSGNRDNVSIRGQGMNGNVTHIFNVAASNFTVADISIGEVFYHAIQIHGENDADSCFIHNVRFFDINEQMLKVSGSPGSNYSDGGVVQCCLFEFTGGIANQWYTGGIDAHVSRGWRVSNNTFTGIISPESNLAEHAIHFWRDCSNTIVENNRIDNCDRGIGFGLGNSDGNGHFGGIIRNNVVHTTRDVGIGLERARNAKVYNNTVHTENYFNSIEYRFDSTYGVHIANNLVNEDIASRNGGTGTVESNFSYSDPNIFVDAGNQDYHLATAHTSIVDQGMTLAEASEDFECESRPMGPAADIGADEWTVITTGTESPIASSLRVFPNPNRGRFWVWSDEPDELVVRDLAGRIIKRAYAKRCWNEVDLLKGSEGLVFLKVGAGFASVIVTR